MIGAKLGPYEVVAKLGAGGPPSLNAAYGRSYGAVSPKPSPRTR
jgi:hypothetical protein